MLSRTWVGGIQEVGSTIGPCPEGGVELEEARFGPLSRANSSAMLVVMLAASWLTVPSSVTMRAWSSEVDDACTGGGKTCGGEPPSTSEACLKMPAEGDVLRERLSTPVVGLRELETAEHVSRAAENEPGLVE
ncbi:hypothetical protein CDL15_Pgr016948 [Punica granatum]|uniref:Uncharacterized protein n=1 Tax=Punica granatum TaxID=22663 RepID=A0A218WYW8_PUNGR|nr:hypothetical protein CDL15_Pgr016948 [Punica granatum]